MREVNGIQLREDTKCVKDSEREIHPNDRVTLFDLLPVCFLVFQTLLRVLSVNC